MPLISAAIAGLVAWIVALRQGRIAREHWVLDKRYVLSIAALELVAPKAIRDQASVVQSLIWITFDHPGVSTDDAVGALQQFITLLREDLVPKNLR